jgi:uncharacterized protein (DUF433 family)
MSEGANVISAFTEDQVERLTGLSKSQLRRWDRTGFFCPSLAHENRRSPYSRIYSFVDIAALRVLSVLRRQYGVSLQHLREVSKKLGHLDSEGWTKTTLYVLNKKVNFDDPESGRQREVVSGQYAIGLPLEKVMSDTVRDVKRLSERSADQVGKIEKKRYVSHNAAVVAGTRIPVRTIKHFWEDGYSVDDIISEYPSLTEADIKAAIAHKEPNKAA